MRVCTHQKVAESANAAADAVVRVLDEVNHDAHHAEKVENDDAREQLEQRVHALAVGRAAARAETARLLVRAQAVEPRGAETDRVQPKQHVERVEAGLIRAKLASPTAVIVLHVYIHDRHARKGGAEQARVAVGHDKVPHAWPSGLGKGEASVDPLIVGVPHDRDIVLGLLHKRLA